MHTGVKCTSAKIKIAKISVEKWKVLKNSRFWTLILGGHSGAQSKHPQTARHTWA